MSQANLSTDTTVARAYETHMVPGMFAHWAEFVVSLVAPQSGERVIDVACGTGIGARVAARAVGSTGKVVGVDIDPGVIEVARGLVQDSTDLDALRRDMAAGPITFYGGFDPTHSSLHFGNLVLLVTMRMLQPETLVSLRGLLPRHRALPFALLLRTTQGLVVPVSRRTLQDSPQIRSGSAMTSRQELDLHAYWTGH